MKISSLLGRLTLCFALVGTMSACSNLDDTQQKALSGGAAGAVIGTVGVAITGGCIPCGTAIGGAVGAGSAYALDQLDKATKSEPSSSSSYAPSSSRSAPQTYSGGSSSSYAQTPRGDTSTAY